MIDYSPALIPAARILAARGALDKDLAIAFGVSFRTIRAWKQGHPDFAAACRLPPDAADEAEPPDEAGLIDDDDE